MLKIKFAHQFITLKREIYLLNGPMFFPGNKATVEVRAVPECSLLSMEGQGEWVGFCILNCEVNH